jgi:hypothetical protein
VRPRRRWRPRRHSNFGRFVVFVFFGVGRQRTIRSSERRRRPRRRWWRLHDVVIVGLSWWDPHPRHSARSWQGRSSYVSYPSPISPLMFRPTDPSMFVSLGWSNIDVAVGLLFVSTIVFSSCLCLALLSLLYLMIPRRRCRYCSITKTKSTPNTPLSYHNENSNNRG